MRILTILFSVCLLSALSLGQSRDAGATYYCPYGCGPYVPMISTPRLSFTNVSPNPVGATNATGGLVAGATNSTLSEVSGDTDSLYSIPVWYSGGGMPLVSPATNSPVGGMRMNDMRHQYMRATEQSQRQPEAKPQSWIYFASVQQTSGSLEAAAKGAKTTKRSFTNQDVEQLNQNNGYVHYDSKTEKIQ